MNNWWEVAVLFCTLYVFFLDLIWMQRICILHFSSQYALLKFITRIHLCSFGRVTMKDWNKKPLSKMKTKGRACSHYSVKKNLPLFATYIDFRVLDRERESVGIKRNSDSRQFRRTVPNFILLLLRSFSEISNTRPFKILAGISKNLAPK